MKTNTMIKKIVYTALFAALTFVGTVVIHIHIPAPGATGYINFGDCIVLVSGILLGPLYGGLAAGIGSAMADAMYGHFIYVPGTFAIKLLMAVAAYFVYRALSKDKNSYNYIPLLVASIVGEVIMVGGYFLYETALYTAATAALGVVPNCMQAFAGAVIAILILRIMKKTKLTDIINEHIGH